MKAKADKKVKPKTAKVSYQWQRGGVVVAGATKSSYKVVAADAGRKVQVKVCYAKSGYAKTCKTSTAVTIQAKTDNLVATQIAAGSTRTCAITDSGAVTCWGSGVLGSDITPILKTPTLVQGLAGGTVQIALGGHTCALASSGTVSCWGPNGFGQLGDGTTTNRATPTQVKGLPEGIVQIAVGGRYHMCALTGGGAVMCWGLSDMFGDGSILSAHTPTPVTGLPAGITQIAAGERNTCVLAASGTVTCWELWDGTNPAGRTTPTPVVGLPAGIIQIVARGLHTCALAGDGTVSCWGSNYHGELGDGTTTDRITAAQVKGLPAGTTQIAAGESHTCALASSGTVSCWGDNPYGQLGDGTTTDRTTPTQVKGLPAGITQIAAGSGHTCARASSGTISCWGGNEDGELGDDTYTNRLTPVPVVGFGR